MILRLPSLVTLCPICIACSRFQDFSSFTYRSLLEAELKPRRRRAAGGGDDSGAAGGGAPVSSSDAHIPFEFAPPRALFGHALDRKIFGPVFDI
jgi:hypothetical protein